MDVNEFNARQPIRRKSTIRHPSQDLSYALNALNEKLPHRLQDDIRYVDRRSVGCISGIFQKAVQAPATLKQFFGLRKTTQTLNYKWIEFAEAVKTTNDLYSILIYKFTVLDEGKETQKLIKQYGIESISAAMQLSYIGDNDLGMLHSNKVKDALVSTEERMFLAEGFTRMPIQLYPERHYSVFTPS